MRFLCLWLPGLKKAVFYVRMERLMRKYNNEKQIYVPDLCADILLKWKQVVLAVLLFGALTFSYAFVKNMGRKPVSDMQVKNASAQLTTEERTIVTELYAKKEARGEAYNGLNQKQKEYYDLIDAYVNKRPLTAGPSIKKYTAAGVFAGFALIMAKLLAAYALKNTVNTGGELLNADIPVFGSVSLKDDAKGIVKGAVMKLRRADSFSSEERIDLLASDIEITAGKNHWQKLYFILTSDDAKEEEIAEAVKAKIHGVEITAGRPASSSTGLRELSESDAAVLFVMFKETKNDTVENYLEICDRFRMPLAGAVTAEKF